MSIDIDGNNDGHGFSKFFGLNGHVHLFGKARWYCGTSMFCGTVV